MPRPPSRYLRDETESKSGASSKVAYYFRLRKRSAAFVTKEVGQVLDRAEQSDVRLTPSGKRWIKSNVTKAIVSGTISRSSKDVRVAVAGLITAAADGTPSKRVLGEGDFRKGWKIQVKAVHGLEAGNCPPHQCIFRTIVSKKTRLEKSKLFRRLTED